MLNALDHGWPGGGVGGTYVVPNMYGNWAPPKCLCVGKDSALCENGEVLINGQRYIWNPEVDGWVVVLDLPSKSTQ